MELKTQGYKSTEFWMSLAAVVIGALLASGAFPVESMAAKVAGMAASILAALGYTVSRSMFKSQKMKAMAMGKGAEAIASADPQ